MMIMFTHLFDLNRQRTFTQAIGFYLVYLLGFSMIMYILNSILQIVFPSFISNYFYFAEQLFIACFFTFLVIYMKFGGSAYGLRYQSLNLFTLLLTVGGIMAGINGLILGLIPVACITIYPNLTKLKKKYGLS